MPLATVAAACAAAAAPGPGARLRRALEEALRPVVARKSARWNNSAVSVGYFDGEVGAGAAAGWRDRAARAPVTTRHLFGYGSGTKMFTARSVAELAARGALDLDAPVAPWVDPVLSRDTGGAASLARLFGANASRVTSRMLLTMRSGLSDWDTDGARAWQAARPAEAMTPAFLLRRVAAGLGNPPGNGGWVCPPGECGWYSSTGYVVLGYVLAHFQGAAGWGDVAQGPGESCRYCQQGSPGGDMLFPVGGTWADLEAQGAIHGYGPNGTDVWRQSPVNGWTCGNAAMTPTAAARFAYDLYGPRDAEPVAAAVQEMLDFRQLLPFFPGWDGFWYGMGTCYLGPTDRQCWDAARGWYYGHPGAAYGFYSWTGYNPRWGFALSVATNEETDPFQVNIHDEDDEIYNTVVAVVNATRGPSSAAPPPLPRLSPAGSELKPCAAGGLPGPRGGRAPRGAPA